MIPFNKPIIPKNWKKNIQQAVLNLKLCGGGSFSKKCENFFENQTGANKVLLTPSCSAALDMSAILLDIKKGDEIIMPSFTFVSTANSFVLRGAKAIFVDIRPDTMNIDENLIEAAITPKTKAIAVVHYAGVGCEMDKITQIAKKYNLAIVEDAAQGVNAFYKDKALGTFGKIGTFSFHETKNYTSGGEGGAILINDEKIIHRAEIVREKGTNRSQFLRREIDKYSWVDIGSSFLPTELQAAFLMSNLEMFYEINKNRLKSWNMYYSNLHNLEKNDFIELPKIPLYCKHNAHIFYIKTQNLEQRTKLNEFLRKNEIISSFHYVPLHSSIVGKKFGKFIGEDKFTTSQSERLLRLPMFYNLKEYEIEKICKTIIKFYQHK